MTIQHQRVMTQANITLDSDRFDFIYNIDFKSSNNVEYFIDVESRIGIGGEAQLFKAIRKSDNEIFIAKIADRVNANRNLKIHRDNIISFLTLNTDFKLTNIIPLIDYGRCDVKDEFDFSFSFFVDILPICIPLRTEKDKKFGYKELREKIIPQLINAIEHIHSKKMVHRDIKPENLYILDETIVLGDFATSAFIENENNEKNARFDTTTRTGTIGYSAPEILFFGGGGYYSDLWSLGMTIASLYIGEETFNHHFPNERSYSFYEDVKNKGFQLHVPQEDLPLQWLINGLVRFDSEDRMDLNSIKKWIEDPLKFRYKYESFLAKSKISFNFERKVYTDYRSLSEALIKDWDKAKEYLYTGTMEDSFARYDETLRTIAHRITESGVTWKNQDLGLAQMIHEIYPEGSLGWKGITFDSSNDISKKLIENPSIQPDLIKMLNFKFLSWYLRKNPNHDFPDIVKIEKLEDLSSTHKEIAIAQMLFTFSSDESVKNYKGAKNVNEIVQILFREPKNLLTTLGSINTQYELWGFLCYLGFSDAVKQYRSRLQTTSDLFNQLRIFYDFFDDICEDKSIIRKAFIEYGPYAYLIWLKDNINLYDFHNDEARRIKKSFTSLNIDSTIEISTMVSTFEKLNEVYKDFERLFYNNRSLYRIETNKSKKPISSEYEFAYLHSGFFGIMRVPNDFAEKMGIKNSSIHMILDK
jgi:serine/threonine protein kinase